MSTGLATVRSGEPVDTEIVQPADRAVSPAILGSIVRAEIDAAIVMAHQFPRNITRFLDNARSMATLNYTVASQCCYSMPKGKNKDGSQAFADGPSVRLAEIVASQYGNIRVDGRTIEERERYVVAQGVAQDLESNNTWRSEVRRGIWSRGDQRRNIPPGRYSDDMVNVTCNAAISIAQRNVIFRVIPRAVYWDIYLECKEIRDKGDKSRTLGSQRDDWLKFLVDENGFSEEEVMGALGVAGPAEITLGHLGKLRGFQTAVQDGEATWDSILRPGAPETAQATLEPQASKADRLTEKLAGRGKGKPAEAGDGREIGRE